MRKSIFLFISFITMFFMSCNFFTSLSEDIEPKIEITNLSLSKTNLEVSVGNMMKLLSTVIRVHLGALLSKL